jgi:hypothetical protein
MKSSIVATLLFVVIGCGGTTDTHEQGTPVDKSALALGRTSAGVRYDSISEGASLLRRPVGLCDLAKKNQGGAGLYRVDQMTGYLEPSPVDGRPKGFTYLQLTLVESWSRNAPTAPLVRIAGGPSTRAGVTQDWKLSAKVGEHLAIMLREPSAGNRGFYGLADNAVFRMDASGGYTNGQLFRDRPASAGDLKKALGQATDAFRGNAAGCKDVLPARAQHRRSAAEPDGTLVPTPIHAGE